MNNIGLKLDKIIITTYHTYINLKSYTLTRNGHMSELGHNIIMPPINEGYDFVGINVPSTFQQGVIPDGEEAPHGLLRVVSAARHMHEIDSRHPRIEGGVLDAHRMSLTPHEIINKLTEGKARVVGLNPTSVNVPEAQAVAALLDERRVPYIIGGVHATLDPEIARSDFPNAHAIVRGTGEAVISPLIQAILEGKEPDIRGVYWKGSDHTTGERAQSVDLNSLPQVNQRELVHKPTYSHEVTIDGKKRQIDEADLFVTYGCPFDCTFCSSPVLVGRSERNGMPPYRRPEMSRLVDDVEHVIRDVGANAIHFLDDMAFVTGQHVLDFHAELSRRGLLGTFVWRGMTRATVVNRFDTASMVKMKETGAWKIAIGVESGSDAVLKRIKKKVTTNEIRGAVDKLAMSGIQTKGFFIMGFPGETLDEMRKTRSFIQELARRGMTDVSVFQFKPYPGTEAYDQLVANMPGIVDSLSYLRRPKHPASMALTKADERIGMSPWLPDDLAIASVPSGDVRSEVEQALSDFYGAKA